MDVAPDLDSLVDELMAEIWGGLAVYLDWEAYADDWDRCHAAGRYARGAASTPPLGLQPAAAG